MAENASTVVMPSSQAWSLRKHVFYALESARTGDRLSKVIDIFLISLISLSIIAVVLESIASVETRFAHGFFWLEVVTVSVFTVEYMLRVWSCIESNRYSDGMGSGIVARLRFIFSPYAVIDLVAILPFYLLMFGTIVNIDMRFLRAIRLLRILKLTRYSFGLDILVATCTENMRSLAAAFFILMTSMLLAASGMYFFERQSQPVEFGSIPDAMWWAFSTLTTVGYGDVIPITTAGKIFGSFITVIGVGMVALPTGILASGYAHQIKIRSEHDQPRTTTAPHHAGGYCTHCGAPIVKKKI